MLVVDTFVFYRPKTGEEGFFSFWMLDAGCWMPRNLGLRVSKISAPIGKM